MNTVVIRLASACTRPYIVVAALAWTTALAIGFAAMARYEFTSGTPAVAPRTWPDDTSIHRRDDRPTLVMFAHPRCPCTEASLSELAELLTGPGSAAVDVYVIFCVPERADEAWTSGNNWTTASAIARVQTVRDPGGVESHRFGARTSGQVMLFDGAGVRVFEGGITESRGHRGESAGRSSIAAVLRGQESPTKHTPVYGCDLVAPERCPLCVSKETP